MDSAESKEYSQVLDSVLSRYEPINDLKEADDQTFNCSTLFFWQAAQSLCPDEDMKPKHVYEYMIRKGFKTDSLEGETQVFWLLRLKH